MFGIMEALSKLRVEEIAILVAAVMLLFTLMMIIVYSLRGKSRPPPRHHTDLGLFRRRLDLDDLGLSGVHDVRLPFDRRVVRIDHVLKLPASILLVTSPPPDLGTMVQVQTGLRYWPYADSFGKVRRMLNPAVELQPLTQMVRSRWPTVRLRMLTVFPGSVRFAGVKPRVCVTPDEFVAAVKDCIRDDGAPSASVDEAWTSLSRALAPASGKAGAERAEQSRPGGRGGGGRGGGRRPRTAAGGGFGGGSGAGGLRADPGFRIDPGMRR